MLGLARVLREVSRGADPSPPASLPDAAREREAGLLLLRKQGSVLPFGLTLDPAGDNPRTWFPRDQLPRASWDELLDATIGHLERCVSSADVGAIALVTTHESGNESGLGVQVETRAASLFLVYPYTGSGKNWSLGEPQTAEGLLVGPLLGGGASSPR